MGDLMIHSRQKHLRLADHCLTFLSTTIFYLFFLDKGLLLILTFLLAMMLLWSLMVIFGMVFLFDSLLLLLL